jgi:hypothetical protein
MVSLNLVTGNSCENNHIPANFAELTNSEKMNFACTGMEIFCMHTRKTRTIAGVADDVYPTNMQHRGRNEDIRWFSGSPAFSTREVNGDHVTNFMYTMNNYGRGWIFCPRPEPSTDSC